MGANVTKKNPFASISIAATGLFLALLFLLHFLKPEIDPSWRLISEYEIGNYGWLMRAAFFSLAAANASLIPAIRPQMRRLAGHTGLWLLVLPVIGLLIAGIFPTGPITTPPQDYSFSMWMHSLGGLPAILGMPVAALVLSLNLLRRDRSRTNGRTKLLIVSLVVLMWVCLIVWLVMASIQQQTFYRTGENVYAFIGYPNRIYMVAYCAWLIAVAKLFSK